MEYEDILRGYLITYPVLNQVINYLDFMLGGKYQGKSLDGYVKVKSSNKWLTIFESTYQITTASGQTSKLDRILNPKRLQDLMNDTVAVSILLDGVGWIARKSDTERFFTEGVNAYPHVFVFTFHKQSLERLALFIKSLYDFHINLNETTLLIL